jgi:hypothetical protein
LYKVTGEGSDIKVNADIKPIAKEDVISTINQIQSKIADLNLNVGLQLSKDIEKQIEEEVVKNSNKIKDINETLKSQLTIEYGLKVGNDAFTKDINTLKSNLQSEIANINGLLVFATDKQKETLTKNLETITNTYNEVSSKQNSITTRLNIELIEDRYLREKELSLFELENKFKSESEKIVNNETKKNELYFEYLNKRAEIERTYNLQTQDIFTNTLDNVTNSLISSFSNINIAFPEIDTKKVGEAQTQIDELKEKLDNLYLSKDDGELLSYEKFKDEEQKIKDDIESLTDNHTLYDQQEEGFTYLYITSGTTITPLTGILYTRVGNAGNWSSIPWDSTLITYIIKPTEYNYNGNQQILSTPFLFYFGLRPGNTAVDKFIERFGPKDAFSSSE